MAKRSTARKDTRILAFVMAGGGGTRLMPLTAERSKPSVPFGGRYRIVDFALSNLINSDIHSIYLLVQYKSQSLIEHVRKAWVLSPMLTNHFVTVVPPQQLGDRPEWFQGTADAVRQNLELLRMHQPDMVLVFGADHIYRMDVRQMVAFHREHDAEITVSALPVPLQQARGFGIIDTEADGRIRDFREKPQQPPPMPGRPTHAFASMGNYLFQADVLVDALEEAGARGENDFGRHVLPRLMKSHRLFAYDFSTNEVPGTKAYEEPAYWRDVGTIEAYFNAHQDVLGLEPRFDAFNPAWPIFSSNYQGPVTRILGGSIENSIFAGGTVIKGGRVRNSVLRREVVLEPDVELEECIVSDYVHIKRGARLRRVIVDQYNVIEAGTQIGFEPEQDAKRYTVAPGGIVVVPMGQAGSGPRSSFEEQV
jgi:glucose-1-phosphate adenylyltransferase